jgi:alpha-amylase
MRNFQTRLISTTLILLLLAACIAPITSELPTAIPAPTATAAPIGEAWWNEAVFYEIFVRSFYDSNGDGIGDFNGIVEKLDYLNDGDPNTTTDLGINALWLMPIHPSPSYHGYDVTDYYDVNPDYGTLDEFRTLLAEAHRRGIRLIMDLVINHTSREHPWFVEAQDPASARREWYLWSPTDPRAAGPWGQQVWHPSPQGDFYYGVFWEGMPDLNYNNPDVAAEMENIVRFWLEEIGVDGFRVDGARYVVEEGTVLADSEGNHAWFRRLQSFIKEINPNAMTVGEIWTTNDVVSTYAQGDEFDLLFDFDLAADHLASARTERADEARLGLAIGIRLLPNAHTANFLTNHDIERTMTQLGGDLNKAKRAATLLMTAPGTPFIYYGEELGQEGRKPDEDIRLPMQWSGEANAGFTTGTPWRLPAGDFVQKNVAVQEADSNSLLAHYRALIAVRNANPALRTGDGFKVTSENPAVLPLIRAAEDQIILIATNLSETGIGDYRLRLEDGPLTPGVTYTATPIWGQGPMQNLVATADGGFREYQPTSGLGPGENIIVHLEPSTP